MQSLTFPLCVLFFSALAETRIDAALSDDELIPCPLVWTPSAFGEPLTNSTVSSTQFGTEEYIIRGVSVSGGGAGRYTVGRLQIHGHGFVARGDGGGAETLAAFELLSNPHECILEWRVGANPGSYGVPVEAGAARFYVGRAKVGPAVYSGEVDANGGGGGRIAIVGPGGSSVLNPSTFELLHSFSRGLNLDLTQFVFDDDAFKASKDFLGLDEIYNRADVEVSQEVLLRKRMLQSTTIASSRSWGHTFGVSASIGATLTLADADAPKKSLPTPSLSLSYKLTNSESRTSELKTETEIEYVIRRVVTVAPHRDVQVCGLVTMAEDFDVPYVAQGRYSAGGLSSEEVARILAQDGKFGVDDGNGGIIVEEQGSLRGVLAMASQFIVVPLDAPRGCSELADAVAKLRALKARLNRPGKSCGDPEENGNTDKYEFQAKYFEIERLIRDLQLL